jgi:hypothetical protein
MNNLLTKLTVTAVTTMALSGALALSVSNPAQALTFNYSFVTDTGYSGKGQFSYPGNPAMISESGSGPTNFLQSLSLSVFSPANNLLDSGNSVVNSVSNDNFLLFEFDALTETLNILDTNTAASGSDPYYFISNAVAPSYTPVAPGSTTFNLFAFSSTNGATFLGSASSIQVSSVPEPSVLGLLALGGLAAGYVMRKKQKGEG